MELLVGTKELFRPFFFGIFVGIILVSGFFYADRTGILDRLIEIAYAATGIIDPNGNGTTGGTATTCTSSLHWECINDAVRSPTAPSTAGDYIQFANGNQNYSLLGTITNVSQATSITVSVYHSEQNANMATYVSLWNAAQTVSYGTEVQLTNRNGTFAWDTATFGSLTLTQTNLDDLRLRLRCTRPGGGGASTCRTFAAYADITYTPVINVTVTTTGTQQNLDIGTTTAHVGGTFAITENTSSRNVTSITVNETGTVNGQSNLDNIRLRYEFDTLAPYDCASVAYNGTESFFGATDTDGFSAANGSSVFTGSVAISTTQAMCVYPVVDVLSGAAVGETIEIQITDPSIEVVGSGSAVVSPSSAIALSGTTNLLAPNLTQIHYHWRNDDDVESAATSATGGVDDTVYAAYPPLSSKRLRMEVSNEGTGVSAATSYRLEYGQKVTTCSALTGSDWIDVGAGGGDWDMTGSGSSLTEGSDTTNIAEAIGGVANENTTFVGTAGQKETSSQTASIALSATQYYEIEYAVTPTSGAVAGETFCFRVSNAGTALPAYNVYPEATIAADLLVSTFGSQVTSIDVPTASAYNGGGFSIFDNSPGSHTLQRVTLTASGTVDMQNDISNIMLWYESDTVAPYDCTGESFNGDETQFGVTITGGFTSTSSATFSDSETVAPTQGACLYVEYDVESGASNGETIELRIAAPQSHIVVSSGTLSPAALVDLTGFTTLYKSNVDLMHYHWRNNDDVENAASSATGGNEDTPFTDLAQLTTYHLRMGVANSGGTSTPPYQYRLEWGQKISTCSAISTWVDVTTGGDEFSIIASTLVDGANTTDIAEGIGGVSNDGRTFLVANTGQEDSSSQTGNITLPSNNILELEYSLQATAVTTEGASYCFRVTNAGTPFDPFTTYAEASIKLGTDFAVTRNVATIPNGATTISLTEGTEYDLQMNDASRAFIRITNTAYTGAGPASTGSHNAADVTAYISNPNNITSGITFTRAGTNDVTRISWEVVEYIGDTGGENEIVVRGAGTATYAAAGTSVTTGTISGIVTDADVVPFITGQGNVSGGRFDYNTGLSTSDWNGGADTATFTRGEGANANSLSYAIIEFTGANWKIQRSSHTYTATNALEQENITSVNSITRTFLHVQKRVGSGLDTHADFGHRVYLSGIGAIQYFLELNASTPSGHTSVAWVIENMQNTGNTMKVWQSNGTVPSGGTPPAIVYRNIGSTINDLSTASIFANSSADVANRTFQEPIISVRMLNSSTTQYELWVGDTTDTVAYRTEVVEWPTAAAKPVQNYFRFYVDNNALDPTDPWPVGGTDLAENEEMTALDDPIAFGESIRLRMTVNITAATLPGSIDAFALQFGRRESTCEAVSSWSPLGDISSTTALWRGNAGTPADGTALSIDPPTAGHLNISVSDVAGTYEEENDTALTPFTALVGEDIEFDWNIEHNGAQDKSDYCFRMVRADGSELVDYNFYPVMRTAGFGPIIWDWKWFDDETNVTPSTQLAATNSAPIDIAFDNIIKLRVVLAEIGGANGTNAKFKVQYSEFADFSQNVFDVASSSLCATSDTSYLWCYADGSGVDNAVVNDNTLSTADACSGGVGVGCGTHNETTSTTTATFDHQALADAEYEFTLRHDGARANAVYFFRLYDLQQDEILVASSSYPSVVTEGASLVFDVGGITAGTVTEGETLDVESTPTSIAYEEVPFNDDYVSAYRLNVNTNATQGYQMFMYADQPLTNSYGEPIDPVTGTNASPSGWATGCNFAGQSCFGYHAGDDLLEGGSARFGANDSYAALTNDPQEVMYSSVPVNDTHDIVYKLRVSEEQQAGDYETNISFLAIPIF